MEHCAVRFTPSPRFAHGKMCCCFKHRGASVWLWYGLGGREIVVRLLAEVRVFSFPEKYRKTRGLTRTLQWVLEWCGLAEVNLLNPELNPICYLLALLGAHHFLHVSRIKVKLLTLRRLMSYICGAPILDVSRSHTTTQHSR